MNLLRESNRPTFFVLVLFQFLSSCTSGPIRHEALIDQILVPMQGKAPHLVNRARDGEKKEYSLKKYSLKDDAFRSRANKLRFICKVAGKMYAICPGLPGLCRNKFKKKKRFLRSTKIKRHVTYLDGVKDYEFLVGAKTICFSDQRYNFQEMQ